MIKDLTEEISHDENSDNSDVLQEKKKALEEDSAQNIPQNKINISFPQVKLEIFFHDILEGPKLEINEIRENETRVLNNEKYGSQGILETLNREDDENGVDCSPEKGCMYVRYTLSSKFSDHCNTTIQKNGKDENKSMCEDDSDMKKVKWDDNDALCIVSVSGPESLVPGTPLYTYAEEPYELFEYTEEPRCLPGRSPCPPLHPLAGNSSSFSTFSKNDLHGYMRLPLPMHSGWYVVSYVRTCIVGIKKDNNSDENENENEVEKGNKNKINLVDINITEKTVKNNIPSVIIRQRIELGKSELFSIEVPVQGVGEDVLLPCNKGVRRRGAGYLGGPIWERTDDSGCLDRTTVRDDKKNDNDSNKDDNNNITECNYNTDFNILSDNGIQDPRSMQSKHLIPLGKTVKMLDVTVEDLKSIKMLSLTISLPHIEQNKKFPNFENDNKSIDRSKNKNEDRNKNRNFEDAKFVKGDDVCVEIDNQKSTESILCRAMIWAYDVNEEKEIEKIRFNSGKKTERKTHKKNNFNKSSHDNNIDDDNDKNNNNNSSGNNCNNDDDKNVITENNENDDNKIKKRTVLRIVVEADVITIHRNNGVVTVESVRTAYGILNMNDDDVIQSILNNSKFDHMNDNMTCPSSKKSRSIPLELTGSTGSINRYGQFISRIFYGEISGGNLRFKDTVSPYSKKEQILSPPKLKTFDQAKSNFTDSMIYSSAKINVEEKEKNLNIDEETNINKNTDINETTDTDITIKICCGFCDNQLVPLGEINKNLPMPTGEFDDVR